MSARRTKPVTAASVIRHGGRQLKIPLLSAPIGPETPAVKARFPRLNQPADLAVVDYYLSAIEAVKALGPQKPASSMGASRLFGIIEKNVRWEDRAAAIKGLQANLDEIADLEERTLGIIKPDSGKVGVIGTWRALVDLGDTAEMLLGDATQPGPMQYIHTGPFDHGLFASGYQEAFARTPPPGIFELLRMMELDGHVVDIRWMAYMLGTCLVETGKTFRPIDEHGKGDLGWRKVIDKQTKKPVIDANTGLVVKVHRGYKRYYLPVKVQLVEGGKALVTEQDGDQFLINPDGHGFSAVGGELAQRMANHVKVIGASAAGPLNETYQNAGGVERKYFGRGYVQVTWWSGYAEAGWALGRKLEFLLNPELVKEPRTAYKIMSHGMRTGQIFANGQTFARFICGSHCDYFNSRQMVNGHSGAQEIADHALAFEQILLASKHSVLA
jgi:hypothetical protein